MLSQDLLIQRVYLKTNSKELEELIREKGEFIQGYFFTNTRIEMNFNFDELKSVTITELNKESELPDFDLESG